MQAAEIAFSFLKRGLKNGLCLSRFAALAYLAANGERCSAEIIQALGLNESSRNRSSVMDKMVTLGLLSRRFSETNLGGRGWLYSATAEGLRVLGLKASQ
jgi:DNA-binding MarR family transcriptional regulator